MYKTIITVILFFVSTAFSQQNSSSGNSGGGQSSSGQSSSGQGAQGQTGSQQNSGQQQAAQTSAYQQLYDQWRQRQMTEAAFDRLRVLSEYGTLDPRMKPADAERLAKDIDSLYRKSSKKDLATIGLNKNDQTLFADFLREKNTGLIKLVPNSGCREDSKVISVNEECLKYRVPGAGAAYSFRVKDYRIQRLADLTYTGEGFITTGIFSLGILTAVGDVPLESVSLQTPGIKYINEFQPETKIETAADSQKKLSAGIIKDGYAYGAGIIAAENNTYILRSIAFNGEVLRAVSGITYNELAFDKRKDITVAFRVVRKDADGSVTILWKELNRKDSPKLEKPKKEKNKSETHKFRAGNR